MPTYSAAADQLVVVACTGLMGGARRLSCRWRPVVWWPAPTATARAHRPKRGRAPTSRLARRKAVGAPPAHPARTRGGLVADRDAAEGPHPTGEQIRSPLDAVDLAAGVHRVTNAHILRRRCHADWWGGVRYWQSVPEAKSTSACLPPWQWRLATARMSTRCRPDGDLTSAAAVVLNGPRPGFAQQGRLAQREAAAARNELHRCRPCG